MSASARERGVIPPKALGKLWTPEQDEAVRTFSRAAAAASTGRSIRAVYNRRQVLGVE